MARFNCEPMHKPRPAVGRAADKGVRPWNFAGGTGVWIIEEE
jgi:hypothetical protein